MKFLKSVIIFLSFIFVISNSFSVSINIYGEVSEYSQKYFESISVNLKCSETLNLTFPNYAKNIVYNKKPINSKFILINNCRSKNFISYELKKFEIDNEGNYRIERNFKKYNFMNYTYSLYLPTSFSINENKTVPQIYNKVIKNRLQLVNFKKSDFFVIYFNEEIESSNLSLTHFKKELKEVIVLVLILIFFLLGVLLTTIYFKFYNKKYNLETIPSFVLSKDERDILEVIKKTPGINQKLIGLELNLSKSRISSYINDLEQKKLIRRDRFGRTFKVYIEKEVI